MDSPTLQARKQQVVREAIWEAATDLFAKKGFNETTVEEIAESAGVSRRSFFRYFSSKDDLMAYGMVIYGQELTEAIDTCPASYSPFEVFRETVLRVAQRTASHARTRKIIEIGTRYPEARAAEMSRLHEVQDRVAAAYARRKGVDKHASALLAGMTLQVLGVTFRFWYNAPKRDISVMAERALATLRDLVCDQSAGKRRRV
jgi:AcrR family transcriptional regulator